MTTIRCLAAVAGLLVLACCTPVENTHLSSPVLPMQEPTHATQAPVLDLDNVLHVGAAAGPAVDALPPAAHHGGASVHHGELPNSVTRAELVAYLHEDAISYVPTGVEAGFAEQLFPDGLLLRFAADPPIVRAAEGTPPALVDEAVRVVQILNMALPRDWQIGFGDEPGPAGTAELGPSEVIIAFAAQEDWPEEVRPPEGEDIGLALPGYELYATGDPDRPFNLEITGGRIWIDPTRTEGDERLGVIAHELIHVLGRDHPDPARFPDSIMVAGGGDGPTEHILHPLDRAALLAVYKRAEVMLLDLVETGRAPISLFDTHDPRDDKLIEAFDAINDRLGPGAIQFGPAAQAAAWRSSSTFRSPFYTTRWEDIPKVKT